MSFNNFLKQQDSALHKQYTLEKFKQDNVGRGDFISAPENILEQVSKKPVFLTKQKIDLPRTDEVKKADQFLNARKIRGTFYYAEKFKSFVNTLKHTFDDFRYDEDRIIIPLYQDGQLIGLQGRCIDPNPIKYITVMLSDDAPKIYGLDQVDSSQSIYIVEGPFDSTFIKNAVAMCGSDVDIRSFGWSDYIWVFDNEPRNREIVNRIEKLIDRGDKIVIWPSNIIQKDINDMVLAGHDVQTVIESNVYNGLEAKLKFNTWKKI